MVTSQQEKPNSNWLIKPRSVTLFTTASAIVMLSGALLLFLYLADTKTISALETSTVFRAFAGLGGGSGGSECDLSFCRNALVLGKV